MIESTTCHRLSGSGTCASLLRLPKRPSAPLASVLMPTRHQIHMMKSWTFVENLGIVWEKEADMAHDIPPGYLQNRQSQQIWCH
jgi:hypothetical protein